MASPMIIDQPRFITVLSVDGGGVRGIIPGKFLECLESQLQKIDGPEARIAHYFDVIAGTSTGGLITTMLTAPKKDNPQEPLKTAKELVPFYFEHCSKIFPSKWWPRKIYDILMGPRYNGEYLRTLVQGLVGETKLDKTLTNVVMPTFDIKNMQPVIFNTFSAKREVWKNPLLSDVCLATSAAPTYLPPHGFVTHDSEGKKHEFNLIDGGVAANNPTLATMNIVAKETLLTDEPSLKVPDPKNTSYLVISLGTGISVEGDRSNFTAEAAAKWGVIGWMVKNNQPLIEVFQESSADLVDLHMTTLFKALKAQDRFLRIQGNIPADAADLDNGKEENLKALEKIAMELLEEEVSRKYEESVITFLSAINVNTKQKTNKDVLYEFAKLLSKEKKLRQDDGIVQV